MVYGDFYTGFDKEPCDWIHFVWYDVMMLLLEVIFHIDLKLRYNKKELWKLKILKYYISKKCFIKNLILTKIRTLIIQIVYIIQG